MSVTVRSTSLLVAVLISAIMFTNSSVSAAGGEVTAAPSQTSSTTTSTSMYEYIVAAGESLSTIARDAIQRYAAAKNTPLSPAQRVYCETTVSRQMGGRLLEIGERIALPFSQLQQCVDSAKTLNPQQIAAWQTYANQTDLSASGGPQPTNPQAAAGANGPANGENTDKPADESEQTDEKTEDKDTTGDNQEDEQADTSNESIAWYWWILALSIVGIVFYLLRDKPAAVNDTKPVRKTNKRKK